MAKIPAVVGIRMSVAQVKAFTVSTPSEGGVSIHDEVILPGHNGNSLLQPVFLPGLGKLLLCPGPPQVAWGADRRLPAAPLAEPFQAVWIWPSAHLSG